MNGISERHTQLLTLLEEHKFLSVTELSKALYISPATIRRDLIYLDSLKLLHRTHGGASVLTNQDDLPLAVFNQDSQSEKDLIGQKAAALVKDRDVIFLDATSTTEHMIKYLRGIKELTIFTNGLETAQIAANYGIEVFLIGGKLRAISKCTYGTFSVKMLEEIRFDKVFFSVPGISATGEMTHYTMDVIPLIRAVCTRGKEKYVLCLGIKYGKLYNYHIGNITEVTAVISEAALPEPFVTI